MSRTGRILFLVGLHGAGKSTLGYFAGKALRAPWFSAGDVRRMSGRGCAPLDEQTQARIDMLSRLGPQGRNMLSVLWDQILERWRSEHTLTLVDGMPGNLSQLWLVRKQDVVVFVSAPRDLCHGRVVRRARDGDHPERPNGRDRALPQILRSLRREGKTVLRLRNVAADPQQTARQFALRLRMLIHEAHPLDGSALVDIGRRGQQTLF